MTARCSPDSCTAYRLARSAVSSTAWRRTRLPFEPDGSIVGLAAHRSAVWLLATPRGGEREAHDRLARSTDSGRSFVTGPGPCYAGLGGDLHPAAAGVVWAFCPTGTLGGALRSTDGGATFTSLTTPGMANSARLAPATSDVAVLFGNAAGSSLIRTTDGGRSWKATRTPRSPVSVLQMGFTDAEHGLAIVQANHQRQLLWRTSDGGATWSPVQLTRQ